MSMRNECPKKHCFLRLPKRVGTAYAGRDPLNAESHAHAVFAKEHVAMLGRPEIARRFRGASSDHRIRAR